MAAINKSLETTREDVAKVLKRDLQSARRIVLGLDCWSKKGLTAAFLGISAAFFNPVSNLPQHILLNLHQIGHPHTGLMLAEKINKTLTQWEIDGRKIMLAVTDNGSNMIKAIASVKLKVEGGNVDPDPESDLEVEHVGDDDDQEEQDPELESDEDDMTLEDESISMHRIPCVAHTLQLVLKEIDKNSAYTALMTKSKALVKSIRQSSIATELLMGKCGKTVVTDCATRWNSSYLMLSRLVEIKGSLIEVMEEMRWDGLLNSEWARLVELVKLLGPFKEQTDNMQTDTLSLSVIIPSLLELSLHLQDPSFTKALSQPLLNALRRRFALFLDPLNEHFEPIAAAATFLDPSVAVSTMRRDDMIHLNQAAKVYIKQQVCRQWMSQLTLRITLYFRIYFNSTSRSGL